jgi:hypothetical protein
MKRIVSFILCISFYLSGIAQIHYPFNPDVNSDGVVGTTDLLAFLSVFEQKWGIQVDYEPLQIPDTTLSGIIYNCFQRNASIDSIYFRFRVEGIHSWHPVGDPNLQVDTIVYMREVVMYPEFSFEGVPGVFNETGFHRFFAVLPAEVGRIEVWIVREGADGGTYKFSVVDFSTTGFYFHNIGFMSIYGPQAAWHVTNDDDLPLYLSPEGRIEVVSNQWSITSTGAITDWEMIPYYSPVD